jgi:hypothetical protein
MTHSYRSLYAATLMLGAALPVAAQGARQVGTIAPHIQSQLWPTRELSPAEAEFKTRVVAMRDSLIALSATIDQADRARRNRTTPAVLMSQTRALTASCSRVERNSKSFGEWAGTLSTNDSRYGEPAIRDFRRALDQLNAAVIHCRAESTRLTAAPDSLDPDKVFYLLQATRPVIAEYGRAAAALAKTLNIRIEATERS